MKYALIGKNLQKSYSPFIHKCFGNNDYILSETKESKLKTVLTEKNFFGLNVTFPYKEKCIKYLDKLSPLAKRIGAVNTIVNKNGVTVGYNTDYYGFKYTTAKSKISFKNKTVLVLGTGGAGKTAVAVIKDSGAKKVYAVNRTGEINIYNADKYCKDCEVIVNATPVGSYGCKVKRIIDLKKFPCVSAVVDMTYNPLNSPLIIDAVRLNLKTATGLNMLIAQAKKAEELFFNGKVITPINEVKLKVLLKYGNIVLTGFSGAGKSTVGKKLSEILEAKFCDTDDIVKDVCGKTPTEVINEKGEKEFRKIERKAVKTLKDVKGYVISTGGGTVIDKHNFYLLKSNGTMVFIKRNLKNGVNSPLFLDYKTAKKRYNKRLPVYSLSDITVVNKDVYLTAKTITEKI